MHTTLLFSIMLPPGGGQCVNIDPSISGVESGFAILTEPRTHLLNTNMNCGGITIHNLSTHPLRVDVYHISKGSPKTIQVTPDVLNTGRNIDLD